jgi:hypothetical protein
VNESLISGLRQEELIRQAQQDVIFRNIVMIHQETVDSYLESLIGKSVSETANEKAKDEAVTYIEQINQLTNELLKKK